MSQIFLYSGTAQTPIRPLRPLVLTDNLSTSGAEGVGSCALLGLPGRDPEDQGVVLVYGHVYGTLVTVSTGCLRTTSFWFLVSS